MGTLELCLSQQTCARCCTVLALFPILESRSGVQRWYKQTQPSAKHTTQPWKKVRGHTCSCWNYGMASLLNHDSDLALSPELLPDISVIRRVEWLSTLAILVLGTAVRQDWELVISQEKRIWVSSVKLKGAEWDKKICTGPDFMRVIMGGECRASLRWILWFDKGYSANKFNVDRFTVFLPWKGPHHTVVLDNSIHNLELVSMNCGEPQWALRPWCTIN